MNSPTSGDRKKWQTDGAPLLSVAQQTLEETCLTTANQQAGKLSPRDSLGITAELFDK